MGQAINYANPDLSRLWKKLSEYGILMCSALTEPAKMSLGNATAWQLFCATGYSAAIVALGGESVDLLSILVNEWVLLANGFVRTVTCFLPEPPDAMDVLGPLDLYRHILVVSLLIAGAWLWILRPHWDSWANELYPAAIWNARTFRQQQDLLQYSYCIMVLGALAAIFLLLFLGAGSGAKSWLFTERWTYLRVPLLATAGFAFVCRAIATRRLLGDAYHVS
jgi:hypothetical protein